MLFNSFQFLLFFPTVVLIYFFLPQQWRWFVLLVSSCVFYMAFIPQYILILFLLIFVDYWAGILIEQSSGSKKKIYLLISLLTTIFILFVFKYFNFFNMNFARMAEFLHWNYPIKALNIILPIGLSFHTFQSLSYVIEVYKGRQKAEKNLGIYSVYVLFFPQLVAGPIERPSNLLPQFYQTHVFTYENFISGMKLLVWGLFKKIVIADRIALMVDPVFNQPGDFTGFYFLMASYAFYVQIYCDFSGYSDMAVGIARILGFRLMENFHRPYLSESISDFWKRWHISLTSWFKDYVYFPLGGNKVSWFKWTINVFIVFLLSGFWHGANWTFLAWGSLHALFYFGNRLIKEVFNKLQLNWLNELAFIKYLKVFITFNLVSLAWIFFRGNSIGQCFHMINKIFTDFRVSNIADFISLPQLIILMICAFLIAMRFVINSIKSENKVGGFFNHVFFYALLLNYLIFFGVNKNVPFIYFQF